MKYSSIENWEKDYSLFCQNPNDKQLLNAIKKRVANSDKKIQKEIKNYIEEVVMNHGMTSIFDKTLESPQLTLFSNLS